MADKSLEKLITDLHESTHREMQEGFASLKKEISELRTEMHQGFERSEDVLKTHRGMMLAGTVAYQTLTKATAGLQQREARRDREMRELRTRIQRLEKRK